MDKLKSLFLTFLCSAVLCASTGVVSAQSRTGSDKILVSGENGVSQAEVDKLIQFYEWAFQASFSPNERKAYQKLVLDGFRHDAVTSRRNTDTLLSVLPKVLAADGAAQAKMREVFNKGFESDLRAADDEGSRMLLAIYERGRDTDIASPELPPADLATRETGTNYPKSTGGNGTNDLVGSWTRSEGGGRGDDGTGKTTYNSGLNTTFDFRADGTMLFTVKKNVLSITQCRITETTTIPGRYTSAGGKVTMNLGPGGSVGTSSCEAKGNFDNTLSASSVSKSFVVRPLESIFRPDKPTILCFDGANDDACFERSAAK